MNKEENTYYKNSPKFGRKGPSKLRQQFNRGMTYFLVIVACILVYFAMLRVEAISNTLSKILSILKPVLYGCGIAYLLNPIVKSVDAYLVPVLEKHMKKEKAKKVSRSIGVIVALVVLITVVSTLINMLIPELITSIRNLIFTLPAQINQLVKEINNIQLDDSTTTAVLKNAMNEASASLQKWMRTDLLDKVNEVMTHLTVGLYTLIMEMFHAVIGVIVSVYILFGKETFINQSKKAAYAIFPAERANLLIHIAVKTNEIFGGFIIGKMIDSIIIGILCFIGTSILKMPYAMLVSVIVGVTNVIPFFGPYIGAIPSAVLIALADPMKGIYFLIFILLLQQFDGNILGPKILGESTGLSSFMVIVAIMVGGGLFGVPGMIVGVPVFAVLNAAVWKLIGRSLDEKDMSADAEFYRDIDCVDPVSGKVLPMPVKKSVSKAQEVTVKAEKNRIWSGAWDEIKRMFTFLVKFIQAKYIGFRLKQKNRRRRRKNRL